MTEISSSLPQLPKCHHICEIPAVALNGALKLWDLDSFHLHWIPQTSGAAQTQRLPLPACHQCRPPQPEVSAKLGPQAASVERGPHTTYLRTWDSHGLIGPHSCCQRCSAIAAVHSKALVTRALKCALSRWPRGGDRVLRGSLRGQNHVHAHAG